MQKKPTKIVRLEVEAFKRLRAVQITPEGNVVRISGRNGAGKSSVLDAIEAALGGKRSAPRRPVREGEKGAKIVAELDGLTVTRTFTAKGGGTLTVAAADGARYPSPQAMLDELVGALSFDPLAFSRMEPRRQRELLRELVGLDTSEIDRERARLFDERTEVNREVRRLEGVVSAHPYHEGVPEEPVDVAELTEELHAAESAQRELDRAESEVRIAADHLTAAEEHADRLREEIQELEAKLEGLRARLAKGESEELPKRRARVEAARAVVTELRAALPDTAAITAKLRSADATNALVRANAARAAAKEEHARAVAQSEELTAAIRACDERKADLLASAQYPLEGLSIDDDGVLLNGLPFEQASSAEQLRASVAIGLALHPALRVLLVRDGSLLDEDSLRLLAELAAEADAQVWLETVGASDGVGVVIEDGAVAGTAQAAE